MPSTYTLNNGIELIGTGEQSGTWGSTTNTNLELLDTALDGQVTVTLSSTGSSGSPNALPISDGSNSNGRNRLITFNDGSDLGGTAYVQLTPNDAEKIIYVRNSLSGSRSILLFQGTYNASNDYEVPAGTTAVVFFNGAGTGAVAANVFNNAYFDGLRLGSVSVTAILDEDNMSSNSATALSTQQSIKAYVDSQVGTVDTLAEILANGNTTGGTDIVVSVDDVISLDNGTNALPSLTTTGDLNTGLYFPAADEVGITTGGTQRLKVSSTGIDITGGFTATVGSTITTADNTSQLTLKSTDADANVGPRMDFHRDSASPANNDFIGDIRYLGENDASEIIEYANIESKILDVTDGAEDGLMDLRTVVAGTSRSRITLRSDETVVNDGGQDLNFRVESDGNENMLFVDAGNDRVGVGTSPVTVLDVYSTSSDADGILRVYQNTATSNPTMQIRQRGEGGSQNTNQGLLIDIAGHNSGNAYILNTSVTNSNINGGVAISPFSVKGIGTFEFRQGGVINQNGADSDFRVESDSNSNMLFVDGGANYVGIGSATNYSAKLAVEGTKTLSGGIPNYQLSVIDDTAMASGNGGAINFWGNYTSGGSKAEGASIEAYKSNGTSGNYQYGMWLKTRTHGGSMDDRLFMDQAQTVFNETGANTDFRVESDANTHALFVDAGADHVNIGTSSDFGQRLNVNGGIGLATDPTVTWTSNYLKFQTRSASVPVVEFLASASGNYAPRIDVMNGAGTVQHRIDAGGATTFNETGADTDFRVESDSNANAFVVDAGTSIVLIGAGSDVANNSQPKLSITTPWKASSSTSYDGTLSLVATGGGASGGRGPQIIFTGEDGTSARTFAKIDVIKENSTSGDHDGGLIFRTRKNGSSLPARLHLLSYAAIFNDDSDDTDFIVESDGNSNMLVVDAGANQVVVGSSSTTLNHALRVAGSVGGFGGDVADTASGSSRTLDMPISELGGGRGTYMVSYFAYANGGDRQAGFMCMVNIMTSPDRAAGSVISERYATVTSITHSGANVRIVFTATGGYTHQGGKISLLKLA